MKNKIKYLIVDTTAFINNTQLQDLAENIYTVQEVVDEIQNKRQLRRLIVLPYDLKVKDVSTESVKFITEFSKKTGDYVSLSVTDIKVMALTHQIEKEQIGTEHLRKNPVTIKTIVTLNNKPKKELVTASDLSVPGFYLEKNSAIDETQKKEGEEENINLENLNIEEDENIVKSNNIYNLNENCELNTEVVKSEVNTEDKDDEEISDSHSSSDSDDEGWITPSNYKSSALIEDSSSPIVACLTTDFAMQNVLKQIGLNIISINGQQIKHLKMFLLRCYTCFKVTNLITKEFCPKCGHKTLKKVAVSVDDDGNATVHINARKQITPRGKKFSIPTFKGGKHANNPILSEDQPRPQQQLSRTARMKTNALDPNYEANLSPFALRDVHSRSALIGVRSDLKHWMQKNPNQVRRRSKKK